MNIFAQIISIIAMVVVIISFQSKSQKTIIAMQLVSATLFAVSFLMLGTITGALLNFVATVRALIYFNKEKFHADKPIWVILFVLVYIGVYVLTFTVFGTEPTLWNFIIELLPVIGMTASNLGFYKKDAKSVRRFGLISSPSWLIYNIIHNSIGATLCEAISIISIFIGMLRHDIKKKA